MMAPRSDSLVVNDVLEALGEQPLLTGKGGLYR